VVVRAGFELRDINEIDDEAEVFEFDGVLSLEWRDERQAFDPEVEGVSEKLYRSTRRTASSSACVPTARSGLSRR
jgi:hypothetical protein